MLTAVWLGLFAGYLEYFACRGFDALVERTRQQGTNAIWLMPMANGVLFCVGGLILATLVAWTRMRSVERLGLWLASFAAFLSMATVSPQIHLAAWGLLAAGLATVLMRWKENHPFAFQRLVRRTLPVMLVLLVGSCAWTFAVPHWQQHQAMAQLPPASTSLTNVLLIVLDTVAAKHVSAYGYQRRTTPFLDELADESVLFEEAYATAPWTLPSHASLFTGRQAYELVTDYDTPLQDGYPTLAEQLQSQGYATAGFVANWHYGVPEFGLSRGFLHYDGPRTWSTRALLSSFWSSKISRFVYHQIIGSKNHLGRKTAATINAELLGWIDQRPDRPFFVFLNYMDAHTAYIPPPGYPRRFGKKLARDPALHRYWYDSDYTYSSDERQEIVDAYDNCLAYLDDQLKQLFAQLRQRRLLDNTLVIIVGDHGEMLGEHGLYEHANCLYSEVMRVPLIVCWPGELPQGVREPTPVSIADVPATVARALGSSGAPFPGASLLDRLATTDDQAPRPIYFEVERNRFSQVRKTPASDGDMQGLVLGDMYFIRNADGREEVYHIDTDPAQRSNLRSTLVGETVAEQSRRLIEKMQRDAPREVN